MFARWKKTKSEGKGGVLLCAVVVKSVRIDGKSRQVTCSYLASIREKELELPHMRAHFWVMAKKKLEMLNLAQTTREKIELRLKSVVPVATEAELALVREKGLSLLNKLVRAVR